MALSVEHALEAAGDGGHVGVIDAGHRADRLPAGAGQFDVLQQDHLTGRVAVRGDVAAVVVHIGEGAELLRGADAVLAGRDLRRVDLPAASAHALARDDRGGVRVPVFGDMADDDFLGDVAEFLRRRGRDRAVGRMRVERLAEEDEVIDAGLEVGAVQAGMLVVGVIEGNARGTRLFEGDADRGHPGIRRIGDEQGAAEEGLVEDLVAAVTVVVVAASRIGPGLLDDRLDGGGLGLDLAEERLRVIEDGGVRGRIGIISGVLVGLVLEQGEVEIPVRDGRLAAFELRVVVEGLAALDVGAHPEFMALGAGDFLQEEVRPVVVGERVAEDEGLLHVLGRAALVRVQAGALPARIDDGQIGAGGRGEAPARVVEAADGADPDLQVLIVQGLGERETLGEGRVLVGAEVLDIEGVTERRVFGCRQEVLLHRLPGAVIPVFEDPVFRGAAVRGHERSHEIHRGPGGEGLSRPGEQKAVTLGDIGHGEAVVLAGADGFIRPGIALERADIGLVGAFSLRGEELVGTCPAAEAGGDGGGGVEPLGRLVEIFRRRRRSGDRIHQQEGPAGDGLGGGGRLLRPFDGDAALL